MRNELNLWNCIIREGKKKIVDPLQIRDKDYIFNNIYLYLTLI